MQKVILYVLLIAITWLYHSCTICSCKKVSCPAYQDIYMDQWIQSFSNNQFLFSSANSSDTFTIGPLQVSAEHEANKGCVEGDRGCDATLFSTSTERMPSNYPKFSVEYRSITGWDNNTSKYINLQVKDFTASASNISDTGFTFQPVGFNSTYQPAVTLGGKSYNQVQLIQADTSFKMSGIFKIYFARNMGLIAYEEYPSHQLWIRQ